MPRLNGQGFWTGRRVRLWLLAGIIAAWLPALGVPLRGWLDFSAFYVAATFAFSPKVSQVVAIVQAQAALELPIAPFLYPPGFALLYVPLTWLPYHFAAAVHALVMFGMLLLAARLAADLYGLPVRVAVLGALAWAPAAASVLSGQNATLALLLIVLLVAALQARRRIAAGAIVAALAYKPQFGLAQAGLLTVRGHLTSLVVVLIGLGGHYLLGVVAAGGNFIWPSDWLNTLAIYSDIDVDVNGWQAISLPALLARVNLSSDLWPSGAGLQGLSVLGYLIGGVIILACLPAMRRWPAPRAVALAAAAGLLVTPHAWVYNATLLLPALAVVASDAARRGWPGPDRWLLAGAYVMAIMWPLGGLIGVTPLPLLVVLALAVLLRWRPVSAGSATGTA